MSCIGLQSPETRLAYVLCTVEHFAGIMMSSLLLGIVFAKASMPTTKTAFSRVCLITARYVVNDLQGLTASISLMSTVQT